MLLGPLGMAPKLPWRWTRKQNAPGEDDSDVEVRVAVLTPPCSLAFYVCTPTHIRLASNSKLRHVHLHNLFGLHPVATPPNALL